MRNGAKDVPKPTALKPIVGGMQVPSFAEKRARGALMTSSIHFELTSSLLPTHYAQNWIGMETKSKASLRAIEI